MNDRMQVCLDRYVDRILDAGDSVWWQTAASVDRNGWLYDEAGQRLRNDAGSRSRFTQIEDGDAVLYILNSYRANYGESYLWYLACSWAKQDQPSSLVQAASDRILQSTDDEEAQTSWQQVREIHRNEYYDKAQFDADHAAREEDLRSAIRSHDHLTAAVAELAALYADDAAWAARGVRLLQELPCMDDPEEQARLRARLIAASTNLADWTGDGALNEDIHAAYEAGENHAALFAALEERAAQREISQEIRRTYAQTAPENVASDTTHHQGTPGALAGQRGLREAQALLEDETPDADAIERARKRLINAIQLGTQDPEVVRCLIRLNVRAGRALAEEAWQLTLLYRTWFSFDEIVTMRVMIYDALEDVTRREIALLAGVFCLREDVRSARYCRQLAQIRMDQQDMDGADDWLRKGLQILQTYGVGRGQNAERDGILKSMIRLHENDAGQRQEWIRTFLAYNTADSAVRAYPNESLISARDARVNGLVCNYDRAERFGIIRSEQGEEVLFSTSQVRERDLRQRLGRTNFADQMGDDMVAVSFTLATNYCGEMVAAGVTVNPDYEAALRRERQEREQAAQDRAEQARLSDIVALYRYYEEMYNIVIKEQR